MTVIAPAYSLIALIAAAVVGFMVGRLTAGFPHPRRAKAQRRVALGPRDGFSL